MSKYYIGVDGGGTKTLGVLFNKDGLQLKRVEMGFANFSVDETISKSNVLEVLKNLMFGIRNEELIHIQLGIAGASKLNNKEQFIDLIEKKYDTPCDLVTDALIALYSIKKNNDQNVIMVLGGTGSVVTVKENEDVYYIGGFGHLLGDEGSGYHLAINALKNIILEFENNEEFSELSIAILKEINAETHYDIKKFVYQNSKKDIAMLSQFISNYAIKGNTKACELFVTEGKHLARQTLQAYNKLKTDKRVVIGLRGGFLLNAPLVKDVLIEELSKMQIEYEIYTNMVEPVIGAYYLGLEAGERRNYG